MVREPYRQEAGLIGVEQRQEEANAESANVDWSSWAKEQADRTSPVRNPIFLRSVSKSSADGKSDSPSRTANWSAAAAPHRPGLPVMADTSNRRALDFIEQDSTPPAIRARPGLTFNPRAPSQTSAGIAGMGQHDFDPRPR
jgi:hypothetical protein